jgi:hypothetical protein
METVRFQGVFVEEQTHVMCRADGGVFRAPKKDVEVVDGAAHVRVGATVEFVRSPIGEETGRGQREAGADASTACLGGVEISCSTGTVIGACTGIRPCP